MSRETVCQDNDTEKMAIFIVSLQYYILIKYFEGMLLEEMLFISFISLIKKTKSYPSRRNF